MIQRVQSLYLLCSIVFLAIFAFMPYLTIDTTYVAYQLNSVGLKATSVADVAGATIVSSSNYIVAFIVGLIAVMTIITILLYNNRMRQILLCKVNIAFYIALYVIMGLLAYNFYDCVGGTDFKLTTYNIFPICALITNWLAMKAIYSDEKMVRDSERMWTRNK